MITQEDIIYFILTDRFFNGQHQNDIRTEPDNPKKYHGGDFEGILKKIPYLKDLGITALWITPVYLSIGTYGNSDGYHGYWALDFEKVDSHLYTKQGAIPEGSKAYLKLLAKELHDNRIKLILDMVVNHTGYHNETYQHYADKKIKDQWFNRVGSGEQKGELAGLPDINMHIPDAVDYFVNNIIDWIEETGIDAIRMDTVKHVEDMFWYYFKSYVKGSHSNIFLIGEVLEPRDIGKIASYQQLHDFDSLFDFPLTAALKDVFIYGQGMTTLSRPRLHGNEARGILDIDTNVYTNANRLVILLDNHDLDRRIKTEILDSVGHWDRVLANDIMKLCLSFLFTTRGIPQLYYGTEIGMEGRKDPNNRRDMRWDVFDSGPGTEDDEYVDAMEIYRHTKKLIGIRRENKALQYGYLFTLYSDYFLYAYMREYRGNIIIVVINNGNEPMPYPVTIRIAANSNIPSRIKTTIDGKTLKDLIGGDTYKVRNGGLEVQLGRKAAVILKCYHLRPRFGREKITDTPGA
jgi:glycosidase